MRFLIAPDKFKGSLSAPQVAENIALGIRDIIQNAEIEIAPMADGGEGTAEVIGNARAGKWVRCNAHGPLGEPIEASYVWLDETAVAVMEMSEAAGMRRLGNGVRDILRANTFGVGEMLLDAAKRGAREIIIGLGGSATNDGGLGMARALGFRFFGERDNEIEETADLVSVARIEAPVVAGVSPATSGSQPTRLPPQLEIVAACDVKNPLLGPNGATRTFGPQKGASLDQLELLERALTRLADVTTRDLGHDFRNEAGAGAAGGLGFGLMSFCDAKVRPGFEVVAEAVGLEGKIKRADVVITGEGSLDRQTLEGKTPAGVARIAHKLNKKVFAIVGRATPDQEVRDIFDGVYELSGSIPQARELLRERAQELARTLKS